MSLRRFRMACQLLLAPLFVGCDGRDPLATSPALARVSTPSSLTASAVSPTQIDLTWQDRSNNDTGFEVHRSTTGPSGAFTLLATTGPNATSHSDVGLTAATQYCYQVRAFRTTGQKTSYSEFATTACATTPAPPTLNAPSGTNAKPASSTWLVVSWIDNSSDEDGFRIERSLDLGATWTTVRTLSPNVTALLDAGRASEQQVCYRVIAFIGQNDSPPSNTDCTTPPAAPTGLTATTVDGPAIDLAWTDHSTVEDGYEVLRATDGVTFSTVADLPASSTSYRDGAVTSNTTYWYYVRAKKDGGFSDFSNLATAAGACEIAVAEECSNGLDDDCDGLIDTDDPACQCFAYACPAGYVCDVWSGLCYPQP